MKVLGASFVNKLPLSQACASTIYGLPHETGRDLRGANGGAGLTATPDRRTFLDNRCHNHDGCWTVLQSGQSFEY
jgi:hypothetical protein